MLIRGDADASISQSAIEEAFMSHMQHGSATSRMSSISQALRSKYLWSESCSGVRYDKVLGIWRSLYLGKKHEIPSFSIASLFVFPDIVHGSLWMFFRRIIRVWKYCIMMLLWPRWDLFSRVPLPNGVYLYAQSMLYLPWRSPSARAQEVEHSLGHILCKIMDVLCCSQLAIFVWNVRDKQGEVKCITISHMEQEEKDLAR